MTHVFVAPHPDDVALSCGGLIASLRELGQTVTIITVFSGEEVDGSAPAGIPVYEREALGFGSKTMWPSTEAFNRSSILPDYPQVPAWVADGNVSKCATRKQRIPRTSAGMSSAVSP